MKSLIMLCLLALAVQVSAQTNASTIDSLVKNNSFAIVVNEIKKKPGFNGPPSHYNQTANYYNINPSVLSPQQRLTLLDVPVGSNGSNRVDEYYRLSQSDGSYKTAFNLQQRLKNFNSMGDKVVLLVQDGNQLKVTSDLNSKNIKDVSKNEYLTFTEADFKITSSKKTDKGHSLTYVLTEGKEKSKLFIDIDNEGKVTATGEPSKESTTVFYGEIVALK